MIQKLVSCGQQPKIEIIWKKAVVGKTKLNLIMPWILYSHLKSCNLVQITVYIYCDLRRKVRIGAINPTSPNSLRNRWFRDHYFNSGQNENQKRFLRQMAIVLPKPWFLDEPQINHLACYLIANLLNIPVGWARVAYPPRIKNHTLSWDWQITNSTIKLSTLCSWKRRTSNDVGRMHFYRILC